MAVPVALPILVIAAIALGGGKKKRKPRALATTSFVPPPPTDPAAPGAIGSACSSGLPGVFSAIEADGTCRPFWNNVIRAQVGETALAIWDGMGRPEICEDLMSPQSQATIIEIMRLSLSEVYRLPATRWPTVKPTSTAGFPYRIVTSWAVGYATVMDVLCAYQPVD